MRYGRRWLYCRGRPGSCSSPRTRPTRCGLFGIAGPPLRQGRHRRRRRARRADAVNPARTGTKAAAHYALDGPRRRERQRPPALLAARSRGRSPTASPFAAFDDTIAGAPARGRRVLRDRHPARSHRRRARGDAPEPGRPAVVEAVLPLRREDVARGRPGAAPAAARAPARPQREWGHLYNADVISMPDKWEYPWYAAWDLAFHCVPLALVDAEFAKEQLVLMLREWYMHPNGQLPAYEWAFGDVNPPVHAWAAWRVYKIEKKRRGAGDRVFLERVFQKLLLNFTWWVNRKDAEGNNVFEGGFLGLDNIGVFDRSAPLPTGGHLEQSDGTSWMAMYSLNMLAIAMELARDNPAYEDVASKFWEHFVYIAPRDEPPGQGRPSSICGTTRTASSTTCCTCPTARAARSSPLDGRPDPALRGGDARTGGARPAARLQAAARLVHRATAPISPTTSRACRRRAASERRLLSVVDRDRLRRVLRYMLDESEFLSPYGIRALSRVAPGRAVRAAGRRPRPSRRLRAGRIDDRPLRRQLELARTDLVPGELPADRVAAEVPPLLRRQLHGRVPDRLGQDADAGRGRRRAVAPPVAHLPARR